MKERVLSEEEPLVGRLTAEQQLRSRQVNGIVRRVMEVHPGVGMLQFMPRRFVAALLSGSLALTPAVAGNPESEDKAKEVVSRFLQRIKEKDVDRLMEVVATPWLADGQRVVKDGAELKNLLQLKLDKFDVPKGTLEVHSVIPYEKAAEIVKDEATRKLFGQVLERDDRIVLVGRKKPPVIRYALVRMSGAAPKVVGGPYRLTYLLMPNPIPEAAAAALARAETLELLSLSPERPREKPPDDFHGWKVLGRAAVKDRETCKGLVAALRRGAEESEGVAAACFNPRHGLRVTHDGKAVDFVICFECLQVQVFEGNRSLKGFLISDSPQPPFDKVLRDAGVPLAAKPEK
jgi:hypothetical protein